MTLSATLCDQDDSESWGSKYFQDLKTPERVGEAQTCKVKLPFNRDKAALHVKSIILAKSANWYKAQTHHTTQLRSRRISTRPFTLSCPFHNEGKEKEKEKEKEKKGLRPNITPINFTQLMQYFSFLLSHSFYNLVQKFLDAGTFLGASVMGRALL